MSPQKTQKPKPPASKSKSNRKKVLSGASITAPPRPQIKLHQTQGDLRNGNAPRTDEAARSGAATGIPPVGDTVIERLTSGLGKTPTVPAKEILLTDEELYRITKLRQRMSAAKERKRLANQKDLPNRDVFTLPLALIKRLEQWSKGWTYKGQRVDLSLSSCAAFLLYDSVDTVELHEQARDHLQSRDHKRWNYTLAHPLDKREHGGRDAAERRKIFQLNNDLIQKIAVWSKGFGNHTIIPPSEAVAFLLFESLEKWKDKNKPSHYIQPGTNNHWKFMLLHPLDPRSRG